MKTLVQTIFPSQGEPLSRKAIRGLGVIVYDAKGRACAVYTRYGTTAPNPWLDSPQPNLIYHVGANQVQRKAKQHIHHVFRTGHDCATLVAEDLNVRVFKGKLKGKRHRGCTPVGFKGKPYDRGHLIASQFGAGNEAINLVTMPDAVNRGLKWWTAKASGFRMLAEQIERFTNESFWGGTLSPNGEWKIPTYRQYERTLVRICRSVGSRVGGIAVRIEPATVRNVTDILYIQVYFPQRDTPVRLSVECDIG